MTTEEQVEYAIIDKLNDTDGFVAFSIPDRDETLDKITPKSRKCYVCKKYDIIHVIQPCGCRSLCNRCSVDLAKLTIFKCPKCKKNIKEVV